MDDLIRLAYAARLGNRPALDAFIDACYDEVRKLCAILVDDDSADDLAQEAFIRLVRGLCRFRGEASARTWLLSIARNTCADELRSRSRQRRRHRDLIATRAADTAAIEDVAGQVGLLDLISRLAPERRDNPRRPSVRDCCPHEGRPGASAALDGRELAAGVAQAGVLQRP